MGIGVPVHWVDGSDEGFDQDLLVAWGGLLERVYEVEISAHLIEENAFHRGCYH